MRMNNSINQFAEQVVRGVKARRNRRRFVAVLSLIVLLVTMQQTKFMADALEHIPACGLEEHTHSETCFDAWGSPVCNMDEHIHTDACYQARPVEPEEAVEETLFVDAVDETVGEVTLDLTDDPIDQAEAADEMVPEDEIIPDDEAAYRFTVGEQSRIPLNRILEAVGLSIEGGCTAGQVVDEAHPEGMVDIVNDGEGLMVCPACDFHRVELAVFARENEIYIVELLDAVLPEIADQETPEVPEDAPEPTEVVKAAEDVAAEPTEEPEITPEPTEAADEIIEAPAEETVEESVIEPEETPEPTVEPAEEPEETPVPTAEPAEEPEEALEPTAEPTEEPEGTPVPTAEPTEEPEGTPEATAAPAEEPEEAPEATAEPTEEPEETPVPTAAPAEEPEAETAEAPGEEAAERLYEATYDFNEIEEALNLLKMVEEARAAVETEERPEAAEARDEEAVEADGAEAENDGEEAVEEEAADAPETWAIDYDNAMIQLDEAYDIRPIADFERTEIAVQIDAERFAFTLLNGSEPEEAEQTEAVEGRSIILNVDFSEISAKGVDFEQEAALNALEEGMALDILAAGNVGADSTLAVEVFSEEDEIAADALDSLNMEAVEVVETEGGVDYVDGALVVTGDGSVVLSDGENTLTANVANYAGLVDEVSDGSITVAPVSETAALPDGTAVFTPAEDAEDAVYDLIANLYDEAADEDIDDADAVEAADETEEKRAEADARPRTLHVKLYDIGLRQDDRSVEPGFDVSVKATFDAPIAGEDFALYHIVDGQPILMEDAVVAEDGVATGLDFVTDSFSPYAVAWYTVDFWHGEFEYHMIGGESLALSELFAALKIERDVAEVTGVTFSDPELLKVARTEDDWMLISLAPFDTEETLAVTFENGDDLVIRVTDEQWVSPYDLAGNASSWVNGAKLMVEDASGNLVNVTNDMVIPEYANFSITIPFELPSENDGRGFPGLKPGDTIEYTVPSWVHKLENKSGIMAITSINDGTWEVKDGKVVITLNEGFIEKHPYGIKGNINLSGSMDVTTNNGQDKNTTIDFLGTTYNTVVRKRVDAVLNIGIEKEFKGEEKANWDKGGRELTGAYYQLTVTAGDIEGNAQRNNADLENIVINDFFSVEELYAHNGGENFVSNDDLKRYITYDKIVAKIMGPNGEEITDRKVITVDGDSTDGKVQFKVVLASDETMSSVLRPDEKVVITYRAKIDKEMYQHNPRGPHRDSSDIQDEFGANYSSDTGASSGSKKNTEPIQGANGQNRSWIHRRAPNGASVNTSSLQQADSPDAAGNQYVKKTEVVENGKVKKLDFNKTWLWKNGDPQGDWESKYEVSVNEGPEMDITGWLFSDPIGNTQNKQEIISDIVVTKDEQPYMTIPLSDLGDNSKLRSEAAGSTVNEIVFKFSENGHYRFFYTAEFKEDSRTDDNKYKCINSAVLKEKDGDDGDTYGVYESHTTEGATVTKRLDYMDVENSVIRWQTTIDNGIGVDNGSIYRDFVGWKRTGTDNSESTIDSTGIDHIIDLEKLNMVITNGREGSEEVIPASDYQVRLLGKEEIRTSPLGGENYHADNWGVCYGYQIEFLKDYPGPVLIHYSTVADFEDVVLKENFVNKFTYQKTPSTDGNPWNGSNIYQGGVSEEYSQSGSLDKVVEKIGNTNDFTDTPVIKWHLSINEKKYQASSLKVVDTIPEGLDFVLERDLQMRWVENTPGASSNSTLDDWKEAYTGDRGAINDAWPTRPWGIKPDNRYFTATYDEQTRELVIVLHDINRKKVEFNIYTQPQHKFADNKVHIFENKAEVWTNSKTQENVRLNSASAKATIKYVLAGKGVTYDSSTAPYAKYKIEVNSGAIDMNPNGNRYIVEDSAVPSSTLRFEIPGSLVVKKKNGTVLSLNEDPYSEIGDNEVRLTAIGDNSFALDVPDNTALTIEYNAYVPGVVGENADLGNTVTLKAENEKITDYRLVQTKEVQAFNVSMEVQNVIMIRKGSTGENAVLLDGAIFDIFDVTDVNDQVNFPIEGLTQVDTVTTGEKDADGSYKVGFGLAKTTGGKIENFHIYKIVEKQAPEGYITPTGQDAVVGTFMFVTQNPKDGMEKVAYVQWIQGLRAKGVEIINVNYEKFTFYKANQPDVTRVSVTKQWLDKDGGPRTTYGEGEDKITFALMQKLKDQAEAQVYGNYEIIRGEDGWKPLMISDLPNKVQGKAATYYVVETGTTASRDDLKVTYQIGEGDVKTDPAEAITMAGAEDSAFTIINQDISVDIHIVKIDETTRGTENEKALQGAAFTLYRQKIITLDNNGETVENVDYPVYPNAEDSVQITDDKGKLSFAGLPDGKYKISETGMPEGYVKYENSDIYFTIENGSLTWTDADGKTINEQNLVSFNADDNTFTVGNTPGYALPSTGGMGTLPYTVGGLALMLLSALLLMLQRRKG